MHFDVIILGRASDPHVASVLVHMDALGVGWFCLDQITLWQDTVTFHPEFGRLLVRNQEITSCSLVWNRRAYPTLIEFMSTGEKKFARAEFSHTLFGALQALSRTWFNSPDAIRRASYKAGQLHWVARDGRVRIPRSLITSNVDHASSFINGGKARFVVKPLYRPIIESDRGFQVIHTTLVDALIRKNLGDLRNSPCIIQEFIERKCDVRINVIGDQIFGTRLDTRDILEAKIDSRLVSDYHRIKHTPIDLPDTVKRVCIDMCQHFNLRFGAFDFAIDADDNWFFLEVNPNGQWYWIEEMTGQGLSAAMARENTQSNWTDINRYSSGFFSQAELATIRATQILGCSSLINRRGSGRV